jgi:6-phosphofructokinase 1
MATKKRVGILTGGGDVPGLNTVIKSVVYGCTEPRRDCEVIGIRRGWEGLTHTQLTDGEDANYILPLDRRNTRVIDRTGGTFLHSSRTNPSKMKAEKIPPHLQQRLGECKEVKPNIYDVTPIVLENIDKLHLDHLVVIGGDDTLSYAPLLLEHDVAVVAVPKTMDNDVRNTEYCIGFSTAMTRAVQSITRLRSTLGSHERIGIFRIFGRDAGFTALYAAYVTSIRCCIPEYPFDLEKMIDQLVEDKRGNPSRYALLLMSEGARWHGHAVEEYGIADAFGHRRKVSVAESFARRVEEHSGEETLVADLTYELRSGEPDFIDKLISTSFATMACDCIFENARGRMMAIRNGCYSDADIPDPSLGPRQVDVETMYNTDRFRPHYRSKKHLPLFMLRA